MATRLRGSLRRPDAATRSLRSAPMARLIVRRDDHFPLGGPPASGGGGLSAPLLPTPQWKIVVLSSRYGFVPHRGRTA